MFKHFVSDRVVEIRMQGIPTRETAENYDIDIQTASS